MSFFAGHRVLFACDIVGFGEPSRTDHVQGHLRAELYTRIARAFAASGVSLADCHTEDRGDGLLAIAPPETRPGVMVAPLVDHIDAELRRQHEVAAPAARLRLRVSVHAGEVYRDEHGVSGRSLIEAFRLLEAPALKERVAETGARLALVVSGHLFQAVIRQDPDGLGDPAAFSPLPVVLKETDTTAWVRLFGARAPRLDFLAEILQTGPPETGTHLSLARRLLSLAPLRTAESRTRLIESLPPGLEVARQPEPLLDVFCLIQACLEHPSGIHSLLAALRSSGSGD